MTVDCSNYNCRVFQPTDGVQGFVPKSLVVPFNNLMNINLAEMEGSVLYPRIVKNQKFNARVSRDSWKGLERGAAGHCMPGGGWK